jgi:hypothetical protein
VPAPTTEHAGKLKGRTRHCSLPSFPFDSTCLSFARKRSSSGTPSPPRAPMSSCVCTSAHLPRHLPPHHRCVFLLVVHHLTAAIEPRYGPIGRSNPIGSAGCHGCHHGELNGRPLSSSSLLPILVGTSPRCSLAMGMTSPCTVASSERNATARTTAFSSSQHLACGQASPVLHRQVDRSHRFHHAPLVL